MKKIMVTAGLSLNLITYAIASNNQFFVNKVNNQTSISNESTDSYQFMIKRDSLLKSITGKNYNQLLEEVKTPEGKKNVATKFALYGVNNLGAKNAKTGIQYTQGFLTNFQITTTNIIDHKYLDDKGISKKVNLQIEENNKKAEEFQRKAREQRLEAIKENNARKAEITRKAKENKEKAENLIKEIVKDNRSDILSAFNTSGNLLDLGTNYYSKKSLEGKTMNFYVSTNKYSVRNEIYVSYNKEGYNTAQQNYLDKIRDGMEKAINRKMSEIERFGDIKFNNLQVQLKLDN